ncbi:N-acetylmuramoyl-L-alanine amidase [Spirulina sp. 06S082]|uniref:N-acetylmuramoyl-L-alanine amidase n=1 Tax=Spirulina sp. 06S082 TaxID=3110248 RepID=UPI002B219108|nr:N-acetylmuramoyl-L-alanine amidase [Spirulina sp. 06S082]MEA5470948.1 N-acetylmuramoyl-L-alanine amidase [Spirulina sp. 06S082]
MGSAKNLGYGLGGAIAMVGLSAMISPAQAESLFLAYPPKEHQTTAEQIFFIGTASPQEKVSINGKEIQRSPAGHFAPSFPLRLGDNDFVVRSGGEEIRVRVTRQSDRPVIPTGANFAPDSLTPARDIARLPEEPICFGAIAPSNAQVIVKVSDLELPLAPQAAIAQLPPNSAVLTSQNQPRSTTATQYQGCVTSDRPGNFGIPEFQISLNGATHTQPGTGAIAVLSPRELEVIEVTAPSGVARTGPGTDYSRLTPLPQGTRASISGREGEWLRLDYGGWIKESETRLIPGSIPPQSNIRSISSRQGQGETEIIFPLEVPVPVSVKQEDGIFTLTLYNTTAQTDTIWIDDDPLIKRLDWQQITPTQLEYQFVLKTQQQWGFALRYEGTSLILTLRHPPKVSGRSGESLQGMRILLDPGHGGTELGARGPNGYPEKAVNLQVSQRLKAELEGRGATVYMTRESDVELGLQERMDAIASLKPDLAFSVHYNALPDSGDAVNTAGVGMFWYHPQAQDLAVFLHNYLVENLERPSYGVFWNNLALTRPHAAPAILLELGFMINPTEFEWIVSPQEQEKLVRAIADGIADWLQKVSQ